MYRDEWRVLIVSGRGASSRNLEHTSFDMPVHGVSV